ncbi:Cys-Gln thioester bond-forming surface protein [Listeria monocytogenes]|nr:Cys-Gln thioester bond-forming surface protein [Listeria monocytogenes]EHB7062934.1 Cys-Gln thioester bond-forming surface protein [Listeria monocytogenes]EHB7085344.1 Cys-Gln thioester bond-forming surface protein [Listeria monocytogenes]EHB7090306.1 Cys-Gln thioester bond-forming surface protein [Listeria monocytogenes]EHB7141077.1 Cys-Gln thioester bond-forming surface protein [Listeria monocytogenes]
MKKNKKKSLFAITSIIILLVSMIVPTFVNAVVFKPVKNTIRSYAYDNSIKSYLRTEQVKSSSGAYSYCLDPHRRSPNGENLGNGTKLSDKVYRAYINGYPYKTPASLGVSDVAKAHYATQMAVWVADGKIKASNLTKWTDASVKKAYDKIMKEVNSGKATQNMALNISTKTSPAHISGSFYYSGYYTVTGVNTDAVSYTVTMSKQPVGTVVEKSGNKFRFKIPKNSAAKTSGSFSATVKMTATGKVTKKNTAKTTAYQNMVTMEKQTKVTSVSVSTSWSAIIGSVKLVKTDENKNVLKGAVFGLYDSTNKLIQKGTTNEKGELSFNKIQFGNGYYVKEISAPTGYVGNSQKHQVNITTANQVVNLTAVNEKITSGLVIEKVDEDTKEPLENVKFGIFKEDGTLVSEVVTNASGKAYVNNLSFGKYIAKENGVLEGYKDEAVEFEFEVTEDNQVITKAVTNKKIKGGFELIKTGENNNVLKDVEFKLFTKDGKELSSFKTDANGKYQQTDLPFGEYYIIETGTVQGYTLNNKKFAINIKKDGEIISIPVVNEQVKASVKLIKKDAKNASLLKGVKFVLLDKDSKEIGEYETDNKGEINISNLTVGQYSFVEKEALAGYVKEDTAYLFLVRDSDNGKTIIVNAENTKAVGSIKVEKVDSKDEKIHLANAEFELKNSEGKTVTKASTNKSGEITFDNLLLGDYEIVETKAPDGYKKSNEVYKVSVEKNSDIKEITVKNTKLIAKSVKSIPKTGDSINVGMVIGGSLLALAALVYLIGSIYLKRKKA